MKDLSLFATTLYIDSQSATHLVEDIKHIESIDKGVSISNINGYQSNAYLYESHSFMQSTINEIITKLIPIYYDFGLEVPKLSNYWFNINYKNCFNLAHNHPHSYFSAVLYAKVSKDSGSIVFERPDMLQDYIVPQRETQKNFRSFVLSPEENMLIIFPAYLYHYVEPNTGDSERISIAFNFI